MARVIIIILMNIREILVLLANRKKGKFISNKSSGYIYILFNVVN